MLLLTIATVAAGLFAGAAIYINVVEHPARVGCGTELAIIVIGALLLAGVVPFTLVIIAPINKQLLDPTLDRRGMRATSLLNRWASLHGVRSVMSTLAFCAFVARLSAE